MSWPNSQHMGASGLSSCIPPSPPSCSADKVALLDRGECPEQLSKTCSFHWKRQEVGGVGEAGEQGQAQTQQVSSWS